MKLNKCMLVALSLVLLHSAKTQAITESQTVFNIAGKVMDTKKAMKRLLTPETPLAKLKKVKGMLLSQEQNIKQSIKTLTTPALKKDAAGYLKKLQGFIERAEGFIKYHPDTERKSGPSEWDDI